VDSSQTRSLNRCGQVACLCFALPTHKFPLRAHQQARSKRKSGGALGEPPPPCPRSEPRVNVSGDTWHISSDSDDYRKAFRTKNPRSRQHDL
jgi:hypothetical protein